MGINIVPKKKKKGGRAVSDAEGNAIASSYIRAMLKGWSDKDDTPEFGRFASKTKRMPVDGEKKTKDGRATSNKDVKKKKGERKTPQGQLPTSESLQKTEGEISKNEYNAIASRYNRAMLKGWSDKDDTPEFGRFASKTKRMPLRKKGGSVKKYARGGGVLRKAR